MEHRCIYQQSDVMFRKSIFQKVGGYRENIHNAEDYDLWLRMSEVCEIFKSQENSRKMALKCRRLYAIKNT